MRTVFRKPLRDLRRIKVRSLTVILMVAVGLGAYAGLYMSRDSLSRTRDTIYQSLRLSDMRVVTTAADPSEIPALAGLPGVQASERRFVTPGSIELANGRLLNSLMVYLDASRRPAVNDLKLLAGTYLDPARQRGVLIERSLAEYHGYRVGDRITLNPYTTPTEVEVVGIVLSPECLIATSDATVFFPLRGSLGVIFAPIALVEEIFGYPLYNEFTFLYDNGADPGRTEQAILAALTPLGIEDVTRRQEEFAYRFLRESLKGFAAFIPSMVMVFGVVIFLVTFITANRLVASQRREVGVLRSMGHRRREVLASYFILALILTAAGAVLGVGLSFVFSFLFATNYANALGLPEVVPVLLVDRLIEGGLMALAVVVLAFAIPLWRLIRLTPREILRPERQAAFTGIPAIFATVGRALTAVISPRVSVRYGIRNLFRHLRLTSATVTCIALPIGLGGAFLVVLYSLECLSNEMFDREQWDVMVNFRYPLPLEKAESMVARAGAPGGTFGACGFGQVTVNGKGLNYQLLGFPAGRYPRRLNLVEGRMFRDDQEKAIVLNRNWLDSDRVSLRLGDWVEVASGDRKARLEIVGLFSDMTVGQAHVPLGIGQELLGIQDQVNGAMVRAGAPVEKVKEALYGNEEVSAVYTLAEIRQGIREYEAQMQRMFYTATGVSIAIAALFLLASVLLNLLEREMEFATLRALGYHRGKISRIVMTELVAEAASAVLLSMPLAALLAFFINYQQGQIYFPIPTVVRPAEVLGVSAWALLCTPLAGLPGLRYLFRLNIAEVVRQKVMG